MSIEISGLNYVYMEGSPFEKQALKNVSLSIADGEFVGIIGHTGSGKSTLIQHLNGLLKPSSGTITIGGEDITAKGADMKKLRQKVGLVFQYPEHQLFEETVYKDISYGPKNMNLPQDEIDERVQEAMHHVGLSEKYMNRSPFELSGGQKRRVAIAGVLAMDPDVLILDEPAAGLDPSGREEILGRLKTYQREKGKTVLLISHSMEDVARYADELLVLKNGTVFCHDTVRNVFSDADRLLEAHLELPQITRLMKRLKQNGLPVSDAVYTVSDALFELKRVWKEENRC